MASESKQLVTDGKSGSSHALTSPGSSTILKKISSQWQKHTVRKESSEAATRKVSKQRITKYLDGTKRPSKEYDRSKIPKQPNTYRLESENPFNVEKVEKIMKEFLDTELEQAEYDPVESPKLALRLCDELKTNIKNLNFDRYKLIAVVTIGEKKLQDVFVSMQFLWNADEDNYVPYKFENRSIFAVAYVVGTYYD